MLSDFPWSFIHNTPSSTFTFSCSSSRSCSSKYWLFQVHLVAVQRFGVSVVVAALPLTQHSLTLTGRWLSQSPFTGLHLVKCSARRLAWKNGRQGALVHPHPN